MFSECNENDLFTDHMFQLFDQEYSKEDPEVTDEKYGRIRDLPQVWNSEAVKNSKVPFGPKNTLVLETDEEHVYECHENSLIFDKFTRTDVWPENGDFSKSRD